MKIRVARIQLGLASVCLFFGLTGVAKAPDLRRITILSTNDIHGGIEPRIDREGNTVGGLSILSGAFHAMRAAASANPSIGTVLVDAGDQFQGSLLSNYTEGVTTIDGMSLAGYDAVVPGNHDYDFGPIGWLVDKLPPGSMGDSKEVIRALARRAKFPFLSANTYERASLFSVTGAPVAVHSGGCTPVDQSQVIDWSRARRPQFLTPTVIKTVAGGVRVALIGLDHPMSATMTTPENVSDLCYRDPVQEFRFLRAQLLGKADIFVVVIHDGQDTGKMLVESFASQRDPLTGDQVLHAVVLGHTHRVERAVIAGVPMTQSGNGGRSFGRIDLYWDAEAKRVLTQNMGVAAGVMAFHNKCAAEAQGFCVVDQQGKVRYDGQPLVRDPRIDQMIGQVRKAVSSFASKVIVQAQAPLTTDRIRESLMANVLTDALRVATKTEIALLNTGGIRTQLPAGPITYEQFFEVLPFNNQAVVVGPMSRNALLNLLLRSVQTCGAYGALMQSGLRVEFSRTCTQGTTDPNARILKVTTVQGEEIYPNGDPNRTFRVGTIDFLVSGGSGFDFGGTPIIQTVGVAREILRRAWPQGTVLPAQIDGRWRETGQSLRAPRY